MHPRVQRSRSFDNPPSADIIVSATLTVGHGHPGVHARLRVVDAGSFSEAARRLGISKALASKHVGRLEQRLGIVSSTITPTNPWQFVVDGRRRSVFVRPPIRVNGARPVRGLALAGYGIGLCLPMVREDIAADGLVRLLDACEAYDRAVHAVYPHRQHLAGKVRAFLDHLVDHFGPDRRA